MGRHASRLALMALAAVLVWGPLASADVPWRSGPAELEPLDAAAIAELAADLGLRGDARHVVVQFDGPVSSTQRSRMAAAGVELLRYVGNNAFFASLADAGVDVPALQAVPALTGLSPVQRAWKLDPLILADQVPEWAITADNTPGNETVAVYVLFHADVPLETDGVDAAERHGAVVRSVLESVNGLVLELPRPNLTALADEDVVQWIEWPLPPMAELNDSNRALTQADTVQAAPYGLDGEGVSVLVYDGGYAYSGHPDFGGRLTVRDSSGQSSHATHVAGTVGGDGTASSGQKYRGMAPAVTIESYGFEQEGGLQQGFLYTDPGDIEDDYSEAILEYGVDVSNNSIGTNTAPNGYPCEWEGNYGVTSNLIDTIVRGDGSNPLFTEPFRIVWANGNERSGFARCGSLYHTTAPPACAKNHITVGALDSDVDLPTDFTSFGPTDDGRIKPDLSAPGCEIGDDGGVTSCSTSGSYSVKCGTSMACPTVTGLSALVLQDYRALYPGQPDFRNSTLKGLLIQGAVDVVGGSFGPGATVGPDYQTGYGSVRIQNTIDFLRSGNFLEAEVDQSGTFAVLASVDPGDPELKITLTWDDVPGTPNVYPNLVNDLDLVVRDPSAQRHYPWTLDPDNPDQPAVRTEADHENNIEQVYVEDPAPGVWQIEIVGYNVPQGPQSFSLCVSPQLVACSSKGIIALDAPLYGCDSTVHIKVVDCDLNTDDTVIETVTVTIASDTEPDGEVVLLTETEAETADFRGTIDLSVDDDAGVLQVGDADILTATYIDADDGEGGVDVVVTATSTVDCQGPAITGVTVVDIGPDRATVTFETDEPALATVRYGLDCGTLDDSVTGDKLTTAHSLTVTGLGYGTQYFLAIDAVDGQGNPSTDDHGGDCYSFATLDVVYDFPMNTDPGWSTQGEWAFGKPLGGGSHNQDPTSGYTGDNVYGYNLAGDYPDDLPARYLTTTTLDCVGLTDTKLYFRRWLGVESNSFYDEATIEVSNNGTNWNVIWNATATGGDIADTEWKLMTYDISAIADNQDTVYIRWGMGPTDGGTTFPGWNIDDVQIVALGGVLAMSFPEGLPELIKPGQPVEITVRIFEGNEAYIPGTGTMHYRYDGGDFKAVDLVPLGGELYRATLPPPTCDALPEFYFSAEGTDSGVIYQPPTAPSTTFTTLVGEVVVVIADDFETEQGWTVENVDLDDGAWDRGVPVDNDRGDPPADYDGSGQCRLTDNDLFDDNSDVDGGPTRLISPVFDLSDLTDPRVGYATWLQSYNGTVDNMTIEISNNGGSSWTDVDTVTSGSAWAYSTISVADFVTPTDQVRLRFNVKDNPNDSVTEGGLDAFSITSIECIPYGSGDFDVDGDIDMSDFAAFQACFGLPSAGGCEPADMTGDELVDLTDFAAFSAVLSGPQ